MPYVRKNQALPNQARASRAQLRRGGRWERKVSATRFIIEGEWSGYHSGQRRVVHRTVHSRAYKSLRAWVERVGCIIYTDGTSLDLTVRDCKPRERVQQINGYGRLIAECAHHNINCVAQLPKS